MDQDETWHAGLQVGLGPGHIVLDGDPAPPPPKGHSPQFSAHICCGQMAEWIKMPLCMEVGLGHGDFALDGVEPTNLDCRSEMCCTRLAGNAGAKKSPKIRHLGTIAQLCRALSSQLRHVSITGKKLVKQQCLPHMSS